MAPTPIPTPLDFHGAEANSFVPHNQGMEDLIKQAFQSVDVIGPQVQRGQFDLIGPNGEIILPQVWEKVVQPDWQITMVMWPLAEKPGPRPPEHPGFRLHRNSTGGMPRGAHGVPRGAHGISVPPAARRPGAGGPMQPPPPPDWHGAPPRPPGMRSGSLGNGGVDIVTVDKKDRGKKSSGGGGSSFLGWMSGAPKKSGKK